MRSAVAIAISLLCTGCDEMVRQPKAAVYDHSALFGNGAAMQLPPAGTVSREDGPYQEALAAPPALTPALIARGRARFGIYCEPCHGPAGDGHGIVPARGFPRPPDFHQDPLRRAPPQLLVDVITNGYGVMFSYADRVAPADRWAIAAYIEALQLSQSVPVAALPPEDRARVEASGGR
ncbi:MAG: c-type cytochrome [Phenylobacterium sp.]